MKDSYVVQSDVTAKKAPLRAAKYSVDHLTRRSLVPEDSNNGQSADQRQLMFRDRKE
jgi:hypothetical protein